VKEEGLAGGFYKRRKVVETGSEIENFVEHENFEKTKTNSS